MADTKETVSTSQPGNEQLVQSGTICSCDAGTPETSGQWRTQMLHHFCLALPVWCSQEISTLLSFYVYLEACVCTYVWDPL